MNSKSKDETPEYVVLTTEKKHEIEILISKYKDRYRLKLLPEDLLPSYLAAVIAGYMCGAHIPPIKDNVMWAASLISTHCPQVQVMGSKEDITFHSEHNWMN